MDDLLIVLLLLSVGYWLRPAGVIVGAWLRGRAGRSSSR